MLAFAPYHVPVSEHLKRQVHNIGRRRAWLIWFVGLSAYVLAVFHRTSLGVAGILAADRFGVSAAQLSTFVVLQLGVYAAMQIPVGVLLDRFGSRALIAAGLVLMTVSQLWFALADSLAAGLAARAMLGAGDAMIFTSVLRLIALWFRVKQGPVVTQVTGMLGQGGAIVAATPLSLALASLGWSATFAIAASLGVPLLAAVLVIVVDSPYAGQGVERIKLRALLRSLAEVWDNPGTRLGLWVHFTSPFSVTVVGMLWGFPFLVTGQGLSETTASSLLIVMVLTAIGAGPLLGAVTSRVPFRRSQLVIGIVVAIMVVWAIVLAWPGRAPLGLLVLLVVVTALGGPGSMVGFDLTRSFHRSERFGRATGVVNVGGFVAALMVIGLIGVVLDVLEPGGPSDYTLDDFRIALSVQFLFWGFGLVQIVRYRRKGLRHIDSHPGALAALRRGDSLLPGLSRDD